MCFNLDVVNQRDQRDFILNTLNEWCRKNLQLKDKILVENEDFKLVVTQGTPEGVCIICSCHIKVHLTRVRQNFSLSNYYKHLKSKKCAMIKKKKINSNDNQSNLNSYHDSSDDETSDNAGSPQRKRLKT